MISESLQSQDKDHSPPKRLPFHGHRRLYFEINYKTRIQRQGKYSHLKTIKTAFPRQTRYASFPVAWVLSPSEILILLQMFISFLRKTCHIQLLYISRLYVTSIIRTVAIFVDIYLRISYCVLIFTVDLPVKSNKSINDRYETTS